MVSKYIKFMRLSSGFTQEQLADLLKISPTTISGYEIEKNNPNFEVVEKIAELCEFDIVIYDRNSGETITKANIAEKLKTRGQL